jgi:hypothetical protein
MFSNLPLIMLFDDDNLGPENTHDNRSSERYDISCNKREFSLLVLQAFHCSLEEGC